VEALKRLMAQGYEPPEVDRPLWYKLTAQSADLAKPVDWTFVETDREPDSFTIPDFPVGARVAVPTAVHGRIAWASAGRIRVFDTARLTHQFHSDINPHWLAFSADGTRLAAAGSLAVEFWDLEQNRLHQRLSLGEADTFAWSGDGTRLVAQSSTAYRVYWDLTSGRSAMLREARAYDHVALSGDGSLLAVVRSSEWRLYEVDLDRAVDTFRMRKMVTMESGAQSASFSPDGVHLAIATAARVSVYNTLSGELEWSAAGRAGHPTWSADSRLLAFAGTGLQVWDLVQRQMCHSFKVPRGWQPKFVGLWISPDNQFLMAVTLTGSVLRYPLCATPLAAMHLRMWEAQEQRSREPSHVAWRFLAAMLEYRNRFDIEIEEDTFVPDPFDIELET
jgi:WD40 repeat protein